MAGILTDKEKQELNELFSSPASRSQSKSSRDISSPIKDEIFLQVKDALATLQGALSRVERDNKFKLQLNKKAWAKMEDDLYNSIIIGLPR